MIAPINNIIKFSNVDGPGNRTSIFFQGCNFKCLYCHNPETINTCISCGKCIDTCPAKALKFIDKKVVWDKNKCVDCDQCIKTCDKLASPKITYASVEDIIEILKPLFPFINGITVSGGECTLHSLFLLELFKEVKKYGKTCLIDSNGYIPFTSMKELIEISDGVMLDVKAVNNKFHRELTGKSNETVLENLNYLKKIDKLIEVRTVLLPNHDQFNLETVDYVSKLIGPKILYRLIRYRPYGVLKSNIPKLSDEELSKKDSLKYLTLALNNNSLNAFLR